MAFGALILLSFLAITSAQNTTYCEINVNSHITMGWKFFDDSIEITLKVITR